MSQIPTKLTEFDNGMTTDLRNGNPSTAAIVAHFDNYTTPSKLVPHRDMKLDAGTETDLDVFQITKIVDTPIGFFGFGQISAVDAHAKVYRKTSLTDPTSLWIAANNGFDASLGGARNDALFTYYRTYLYGGNTTGIWKYDTVNLVFTYNDYTSHSPSGPSVVVGDILYIPSGNLLLQNDQLTGAGWSVGLTLDSALTIKSIDEMPGGNIAIGCDRTDGTSIVYLWNRDTTQQPYDRIPWGFGSLQHIANLGGTVTGISVVSTGGNVLTPQIQFKQWTGSRLVVFQKFDCSAVVFPTADKQKFNDLFYFLAEITLNGSSLKGLWKIYQKPTGQFAVSFDRLPRNDTAVNSGALKGFLRAGDYVFICYLNPADNKYTIWRTNEQASYTATSIFETIIFNSVLGLRNKHIPDSSQTKDFVGAAVTTESLPANASVVVKYKTENQTNWTTFLTHNTQTSLTDAVTRLAAQVPEHHELYLRLESTNGGVITGFDLLQEVTGKKPY